MKRDQIPGQVELMDVFVRMVDQERLPHAILVHGLEGGTSLPLATFLATYLQCSNRQEGDPCGACGSCKNIADLQHPDVHWIYPVNSTKRVKKQDDRHSTSFLPEWREALSENPFMTIQDWYKALDIENKQGFIGELEVKKLREKLALRAMGGGYRVFIIWEAHLMNPTFGNKLLKNLEEPNPQTVFILVTTKPDRLLTTILSRVQRYQEEPLKVEQLAKFLQDQHELDEQHAYNVAFRSEGSINTALKEAQDQESPWLDSFKTWMRMAYQRDMMGLFQWSQVMASAPRESGRQFVKGALHVLDRCFRMGWMETNIPMEGEEAAFYKNFSPFINESNIEGFMLLLEEAMMHIERNVNGRIVWYDTSIKAVRLIHQGKKKVANA